MAFPLVLKALVVLHRSSDVPILNHRNAKVNLSVNTVRIEQYLICITVRSEVNVHSRNGKESCDTDETMHLLYFLTLAKGGK